MLLLGFSPVNVLADTQGHPAENERMLRWVNTAAVTVELVINNGRANLAGVVIGNTGVESITGTAVLERVNADGTTTHIHTWRDMRTNGSTWLWESHRYVARGHDYRFTLTAIVIRNGVSETVSLSRTTRAN